MERHAYENNRSGWYQDDGAGRLERVAVDLKNPADSLEEREEVVTPVVGGHSKEAAAILRRFFELCSLRSDGRLHTPEGMAMRLCCLASLLQVPPMEGVPFMRIAEHCGLTRAAVSKTMLELSTLTGIRSRQQRSDRARLAYSRRAFEVHARSGKKKPEAPEETTGSELPNEELKTREGALHHA